jgi:ATP-dependent helicase HrpA
LLTLALAGSISALEREIPPAFRFLAVAAPSREQREAMRAALVARAIDGAFHLDGASPLPRTKAEFERLARAGAPHLTPAFRRVLDVVVRASSELEGTLDALRNAAKHPSATTAIQDIRTQLAELLPVDVLDSTPLHRLEHVPRYLRAMRTRLQRAIADPRKDADKLSTILPVWNAFVAKRTQGCDEAEIQDVRWAFEELRVAVFAPELKTTMSITAARLAVDVAALGSTSRIP